MQTPPVPAMSFCLPRRRRSRWLEIGFSLCVAWACLGVAHAQPANSVLGIYAQVVGPTPGTNSVVLGFAPQTNGWTATANDAWLHISPGFQSGAASTNVIYSFDSNPGATRSGTLIIAGLTLTVTQAGSTFVPARRPTGLFSSSGAVYGAGIVPDLALDNLGDLYFIGAGIRGVQEWERTNDTFTNLATPWGGALCVAADGSGNIYACANGQIAELAITNTTTVLASNLGLVSRITADASGNLYFTTGSSTLEEFTRSNNTVVTLVTNGFTAGGELAADAAGNVYIADSLNTAIEEWTAANKTLSTLVSGLNDPFYVAVDGAGNVYFASYPSQQEGGISKWTAANNLVTTMQADVYPGYDADSIFGLAVDAMGDVFFGDATLSSVDELPYGFVDSTAKLEPPSAGTDSIYVLPSTFNLQTPFAPVVSQPWLTVTGITNGSVNFSFPAYNGLTSTARINVLGESILVTQAAAPNVLGAGEVLEPPSAGSDSVVLAVTPSNGVWTAAAQAPWLHLSAANQNGAGSTNVVFSFDANPGATRSGAITIGGQTLTVTQAGSTYVAAEQVTTLASEISGFSMRTLAVDGSGDVFGFMNFENTLNEWVATNEAVTQLHLSGFPGLYLAADSAGNVYFAGASSIVQFASATQTMVPYLFGNFFSGAAVGPNGNVYSIVRNSSIVEFSTANNDIITNVPSGLLTEPIEVAVDGSGNVYITDPGANAIEERMQDSGRLISLVSSGLGYPEGLAVDGGGNVYIADSGNDVIEEWNAVEGSLTTFASPEYPPLGVAVDASRNVYFNAGDNLYELPHAFVDASPKLENTNAANDTLPVLLPATANLGGPFAPTTDEPWLAVTGVTNGVVSFSVASDPGPSRFGHINVLGQSILVAQLSPGSPQTLTGFPPLANGAFEFAFGNAPATFTVLSATNLSVPLSKWTVVGTATNSVPGVFQFAWPAVTNDSQRYFRIRSP